MFNRLATYAHENGGRVIILFLLFILILYEFQTAGFNTFALLCFSPLLIIALYAAFKWRSLGFWFLIVVNYFIPFKNISWHLPISLIDEALELFLLAIAIIDARQTPHFGRAVNVMLLALMIWFSLCFFY